MTGQEVVKLQIEVFIYGDGERVYEACGETRVSYVPYIPAVLPLFHISTILWSMPVLMICMTYSSNHLIQNKRMNVITQAGRFLFI